ncbi:MAG TPA: FeoA family protein [Vicinamibacterales bacterium]|nr:FeoA family protein [Vicinamibacterales bacterium]
MTRSHLSPLSSLPPGARGRVVRVVRDLTGRAERLAALGVTPGAPVRLLQTFPGIVFECDQTEMAVERRVAAAILVEVEHSPAAAEARR